MNRLVWTTAVLAALGCGSAVWADNEPPVVLDAALTPQQQAVLAPLHATLADPAAPQMLDVNNDESVYGTPPPPNASSGVNSGGAKFNIEMTYLNKYVFRGVDHDRVAPNGGAMNLLINGDVEFDLGKLPHPFFGVTTNIYDSDPVSRFQEILPYAGARWTLAPFTFEFGLNEYIYPNREDYNTDEVYLKTTMDDSFLFHTQHPVFQPYMMAAFDYERSNGWYIETGISHDFIFEELGLTLTPKADVAYINHYKQNFIYENDSGADGFQHADVGIEAKYSLNTLFNLSRRLGEFDLKGYLYYTDKLQANVTADYAIWGGVGIGFTY